MIDSNGCPTDVSILGPINKRVIKRNDDKGTKGNSGSRLRDDRKINLDDSDGASNNTSAKKSVVDKFKSAKLAATNEYEFNLNTKQLEASFEAFKFPTTGKDINQLRNKMLKNIFS